MLSGGIKKYTANMIIDAISNADSYRYTAAMLGDYRIIDILIDSEHLVEAAGFNEQEKELVKLRYKVGLIQMDVAEIMQISQPRICQIELNIKAKINKVLFEWGADC